MARRRQVALGLAACLAVVAAAPASAQRALARFAKSSLAIQAGGTVHRFSVEIARTPREQAQGLMFRRRLPPDAGMLFVYDPPRPVSMWMRNTYIPLDMIFISPAGRISHVAERTVPLSMEPIPSRGTVRAVLELNAGHGRPAGHPAGQPCGDAGARRLGVPFPRLVWSPTGFPAATAKPGGTVRRP